MAYAQVIATSAICASGLSPENIYENCRLGISSCKSGYNSISEEDLILLKKNTPASLIKSKSTILSFNALSNLLSKTNWSPDEISDCGFVFATTTSEIDIWEPRLSFINFTEKISAYDINVIKHQSLAIIASDLKKYFNINSHSLVLATSCSASSQAIALASLWIKSGKVKRCIVGSTEIFSELTSTGFESLRLISKTVCTPFDKNRKGINLGEASAFIALENVEEQSKKTLGYIQGFGMSTDAYHSTSPEPNGLGCERSVIQALKTAKLTPHKIDWFYAHGTGSMANDQSEAKCIERIFKNKVFTSSSKIIHGHTLAASGILETVLSFESFENQNAILNSFSNELDSDFDINLNQPPKQIKTILKNSLGFGGINCSLVLSKEIQPNE